uniref:Charged multivesicular body protein 4b n=1 Tax=Oryza punctata TaxID=4537 RepID=A0A0E0MJ13_ORYPU
MAGAETGQEGWQSLAASALRRGCCASGLVLLQRRPQACAAVRLHHSMRGVLARSSQTDEQGEGLGHLEVAIVSEIEDQIIMLESAKATTDTVDALRSGSSAVKAIHQSVSIDDIENAIEEANKHTENMRQIQEALATPIGAFADFDEDELEAELEDLEEKELENELPEPPQRTSMEPSARVTTSSQPANDLAELTKLQAEMAL